MKKNIAFILSLALIGTCAAPLSQAGIFNNTAIVASAASSNGFQYSVSSNGATITGYTGSSSSVTIPATLGGKNVTSIGAWAFSGKSIQSVTIPDTVTSLGDYSFYNCTKLKKVVLSNKLQSSKSGGYLFYLSPVTEVVVNGNMSDSSFIDHFNYHTDAVVTGTVNGLNYSMPISNKEVTVTGYSGNGGVVSIPDYIIGKPVTTVGESAFNGNRNITEIKFGNNVKSLKKYSFNNCTALKTITLGPKITTAASEGYLFNGCDNLKTINMPYEMEDKNFVFHFRYLNCFTDFIRTATDKRAEEVLKELKASNPSLNWNIRGLQGAEREKAKYEVAKYIHSRLGSTELNDKSVYIHYIDGAEANVSFCLASGEGTCAGMSSAYALLLYKAGFNLDEIDLIGAPQHQLAGVKLFGQWYLVECTNNAASSFAMHHNSEWYKSGTANGVKRLTSDADLYQVLSAVKTNSGVVYELNSATQNYLTNKYGRANGGANSKVNEYPRGDINMDGSVNSMDMSSLRSYLNGSYGSNMNLVNCDFNRDGKIDSNDLKKLQDFLLGR